MNIPVRVAEGVFTVGDTLDYLRMQLVCVPVRECLSQKIFYKLRRALIENYRVKRSEIEPSTKLSDVLSEEDIESGWPYLELFVEMKTPDFWRSNEIFGLKLSEETIKEMTLRELVSRLISLNSEKFLEERDSDQEIWRRLVDVIVRQLSVKREEVVPSAHSLATLLLLNLFAELDDVCDSLLESTLPSAIEILAPYSALP